MPALARSGFAAAGLVAGVWIPEPPEPAGWALNRGFESFAAEFDCGFRADKSMQCLDGTTLYRRRLVALDGRSTKCGILRDGRLRCWVQPPDVIGGPGGHPRKFPFGDERFTALSAGGFQCAIRKDGALACTQDGFDPDDFPLMDPMMPPAGEFTAVAVGFDDACAIGVDRELACWHESLGGGSEPLQAPPAGEFVSVSVGIWHACAVRVGGEVVCWGDDADGRASPPAGTFRTVAVADYYSCGLRGDGDVRCWGLRIDDPATRQEGRNWRLGWNQFGGLWPAGPFTALSSGPWIMCGIREDATVACWGASTFGTAERPPEGRFVSVSVGSEFSCGVRIDGEVVCWGLADREECGDGAPCVGWNLFPGSAREGPFTSVSVTANRHYSGTICGLRGGGELVCWNEEAVFDRPPVGRFVALDAGPGQVCGVRLGGAVECWGLGLSAWSPPPAGRFRSVSVGASHACGLRPGRRAACWGDGSGDLSPPEDVFASVSVGEDFACGLRADGEVVCWGSNAQWRASPPAGPFVSVSAGGGFACGLRPDGQAVCWGDERDLAWRCQQAHVTFVGGFAQCRSDDSAGLATPPGGAFASVVAAEWFACGLRRDGAVECWRHDDRADPPTLDGSFVEISAHGGYLCGLRPGGRVDCWDGGSRGRVPSWWARFAPAGTFSAVAASRHHACGIRRDRTLACWSRGWPPGAGVPDSRFGEPRVSAEPPATAGYRTARPPSGCGVPRSLAWVLEAPPGPFDALDSGEAVTCGRRPDGTVDCWGSPPGTDPPRSIFGTGSVGIDSSCGVRADGTATCWLSY